MGEYEPDDSRNVTQTSDTAPGEPPRTGPREDAVRRRANERAKADKQTVKGPQDGTTMPQPQHKAGQKQEQSQSQSDRSSKPGNPETQDMQSTPSGPLAGNQPQGIDNQAGSARPHYDQYEVNQPQNMHQPGQPDKNRKHAQAKLQERDSDAFRDIGPDSDQSADAAHTHSKGTADRTDNAQKSSNAGNPKHDDTDGSIRKAQENAGDMKGRGYGGRDKVAS